MCQWCRRLLRGLFRQGVQCKGKPALLFQRFKKIQFSWFSLYSFVFCEPTKSCRSSQWQYMCIVTYSNSVSLCKLVNELAWFITFLSTFINQTHFAQLILMLLCTYIPHIYLKGQGHNRLNMFHNCFIFHICCLQFHRLFVSQFSVEQFVIQTDESQAI